ncbi:restriction endonuclease [Paenibacillus lautus]|uniref:restriction endonuclease n=1 Tax=Paenibacillus lautus TaxID=1401 RepID=UPI003D27E9C1
MKITNIIPTDWKDLQLQVAKIFSDMGCKVKVEENIDLVRGTSNIDVFVEDITTTPTLIYLCECKNWNSEVPKSVIHSFKSIVSDSGAHCGYIISKTGFQSGAYETAYKSNIFIMSWEQFIETFEDRWIQAMINKLHVVGKPLRDYCYTLTDFYKSDLDKLNRVDRNKFDETLEKYRLISTCSSKDNYLEIGTGKYIRFEVDKVISKEIDYFFKRGQVNSYDEYFSLLTKIHLEGIELLDSLLGKQARKQYNW